MISFEEAREIVMGSVVETGNEIIPFTLSYGRILSEDVLSDIDMPPFNRSAVDGYACRREDLDNDLEVLEVIAAGKEPSRKVGKNQCSKIMTGAVVPDGCDIVVMVEESEETQPGRIRFTGSEPKLNMSFRGEDVKKGEIVIRKSKIIQPQDIALMASVGHTRVTVKMKPVAGILSTGNELIDPSQIPAISQIRNSNSYQLAAQVERAGGTAVDYGITPDDETKTYETIKNAIENSNIVIITGGVSMGDFDFVPSVLERTGVKILFDRVNVQPGKPTTFGVHSKAVVFGLPGNPVSSFMQFELLVRPLINSMMGNNRTANGIRLPMAVNYERKSTARLGFIPVRIENMKVVPVKFHGSAHIASLSGADGIIALSPGIKSLAKGEIVDVRQI